jgi:hypothetical protein
MEGMRKMTRRKPNTPFTSSDNFYYTDRPTIKSKTPLYYTTMQQAPDEPTLLHNYRSATLPLKAYWLLFRIKRSTSKM